MLKRVRHVAGVLDTALSVSRLALGVPVGYLTILTAAAWVGTLDRRDRARTREPATRYAVVVPAHDEEAILGATLAAMTALEWPADRCTVHVVADHCSDATVDIARDAGVVVHERMDGPGGKGPALQWAISRILGGDDDAVDVIVVVDADTRVDPGLLAALDRSFARGFDVVQGQYRVLEPGSSTVAGLRAAALALRHHLRPLGRTTLGASSGLFGNGMAFRAEVLRDRPWTNHLTEDVELQMELLLEGTLVGYAPGAVVEAQMPSTLEGARTQNERWERGRLDLARRYIPRLLDAAVRRPEHRVAAVDGALDHLVPPLSVLVAATGGVAVLGSAVRLATRRRLAGSGWLLVLALGAHVASGLVLARVPRSVYRALLHAPSMVLWKVRLWVRMVRRPGQEGWVRTPRAGGSP